MRPRRCVWCYRERDACPEGDHGQLGRRPFWAWRLRYASPGWISWYGWGWIDWYLLGGKQRADARIAQARVGEQ